MMTIACGQHERPRGDTRKEEVRETTLVCTGIQRPRSNTNAWGEYEVTVTSDLHNHRERDRDGVALSTGARSPKPK